jgi:hypothetical protein
MLIPFAGRELVNIGSELSELRLLSLGDALDSRDKMQKDLIRLLKLLRQLCRKLGWDRLEFQVEQALNVAVREKNHHTLLTLADQIHLAFYYECNHHVFFPLPEKYRHLVEHWPGNVPFGPEVRCRFSRSCAAIDSAMRSLAFGLPTASVYHLMGVLQEGINAIAKDLRVPVLLTSTWEDIIGKLDGALQAKRAPMTRVEWKRVEPFYSEALSDLRSVKNAWRNPTMHFTRSYHEREAQKIFDRTEAFMVHLAKRLRQAPAPK